MVYRFQLAPLQVPIEASRGRSRLYIYKKVKEKWKEKIELTEEKRFTIKRRVRSDMLQT